MNVPINAKRLRATLPDVVERVRKGASRTVIYRSRPAFPIVPVDDHYRHYRLGERASRDVSERFA